MHVALTEILRCASCGEGLVLLSEVARGSRAIEGSLGCPGCGARYPVRGGVADLRPLRTPAEGVAAPGREGVRPDTEGGDELAPGGASDARAEPPGSDAPRAGTPSADADPPRAGPTDAALRLGALLGLADARGVVVLVAPEARHAGELARLLPGLEIVTVDAAARGEDGGGGSERESRLLTRQDLPIADRRVAGVALATKSHVTLREAVRVVAPGSRVVVTAAREDTARELERLGCRVLADEAAVVVAERLGPADPPRLYQLA